MFGSKKTAYWIQKTHLFRADEYECSTCGRRFDKPYVQCPYCGRKMTRSKLIITALESHLSGLDGAMVPDFESQQLYAAKGSLHE